jgi:hypothetical protein
MPQNSMKNYFQVVSDYFPYKNGPINFVRSLYSSLDIGTNNLPTCTPLGTSLGPFGVPKFPKTA